MSSKRGYKGSRLIIANMFLLLTLCSILPSVRSAYVAPPQAEIPCDFYTDLTCDKCLNSPFLCEICRPGFGKMPDGDTLSCIPLWEIHSLKIAGRAGGYGWDSATSMFTPCASVTCANCWRDYTSCDDPSPLDGSCTSNFQLIRIDPTDRSINCIALGTRYTDHGQATPLGANAPVYMAPCRYRMANDCHNDYSKSTSCKPNSFPYGPADSCYGAANAELYLARRGLKPTISGGTLVPCLDPHCLNCGSDYSFCAHCNYYALNHFGRCIFINAPLQAPPQASLLATSAKQSAASVPI
jgi:hypothetical protein